MVVVEHTDAPSPALVWLRALALGAAALGSGVVSHLLGGGLTPGPWALGAMLAVSVVVSAQFLLHWAGPVRLVALVVGAQTLSHGVLSLVSGHRGDVVTTTYARPAVPATPGERTGSLHDVYVASVPTATTAPEGAAAGSGFWAHQLEHFTAQGPAMVLAHVGGAVVLALVLSRGESSLRALLALGSAYAARLLDAVLPARAWAAPVPRFARVPALAPIRDLRRGKDLTRLCPRRGPPFVLAA